MPKLTNRWAVLALIVVARFSMAVQFQSIPPLAPFLAREFGLNYGQIGTLIGLFMFPGVFLALPSGLLGQRFGDKRVIVAGLALLTAGAALLANATSFPLASVARFVGGVGMLLLNVETTKITADWFSGKDTSTAMGIMLAAWPLGIAFSLSFLGLVASASSWNAAVTLTSALSGVVMVLVVLLYADPPPAAQAGRGAEPRRMWRISRRELILIAVIGTAWMLGNASYIVFLSFAPGMLIAGGRTRVVAGALVGLASWTSLGSVPLGGWIADRVGHLNALILSGTLVGAVAMVLATSGYGVAPWMVLYGLAVGLSASAVMTLAAQVLSPEGRHTGFGVFYTLFNVGLAVLPPIAGRLRDATGSASAPVLFAALILVLTAPALFVFRWLQRRLAQPAT